MKNKKGFTLIELLAVLVVLAILALISIPITIRIINSARENSYKRSIANYGKTFEKVIALDNMGSAKEDFKSLNSYESKVEENYSGNRVKCNLANSSIINGKLKLVECRVVDSKGDQVSEERYTYSDGKVSVLSYPVYSIGNEITVAGGQYYVIDNSDKYQDYVVALKAEPLTVDDVNTYGGEYVNRYIHNYYGSVGSAYDMNGYGGISYYSSETCGWPTPHSDWVMSGCDEQNARNYKTSHIKRVVDNWAQNIIGNNKLKEINEYRARLITKDEARNNLKCDKGCSKSPYTWTYNENYNYWTMTPYEDNIYNNVNVSADDMYEITNLGVVREYQLYAADKAVRPVINVYKSAISQS